MKKFVVVLVVAFVVLPFMALAGVDATNVTFVDVYPSTWTNGGVTTATMVVVFEFPSKAGTNPRLQSAPDLTGTWRSFTSGEVVTTKIMVTNYPWTAMWHLNNTKIGTEHRFFRVLYTK